MAAAIEDVIRAVLVPILLVTGTTLALLVLHVILLHATRELHFRWRTRQRSRYRPIVESVLFGSDFAAGLRRLQSAPRHHRGIIATLLLEPLRVTQGTVTDRARQAADVLGLAARWRRDLRHARWWKRAEAAHVLGLVHERDAVGSLIHLLDDPYEDVRAAAVEALGAIGDGAAIGELLTRLEQQSRHQRVRVVQALRGFGSAAVAPALTHARRDPASRAALVDLLGALEAAAALPDLTAWLADASPDVRAAAARAIGAIGVDDRAYYHLLRALSDGVAEVRAEAAWALGRSGRQDGAPHLAARLGDDWIVAAQSARALRDLGVSGRRALEAAAADGRSELARQMLWDLDAARAS